MSFSIGTDTPFAFEDDFPGSSGGRDAVWALQLCASEDGRSVLGTVGPPLPFKVFPRRPGRPSAPFLISTGTSVAGCFLVVAWREPLDEGGAPVLGHDLRLWEQERFMRGEEPLLFSGQDVWPEYHMEGVEPGVAYVLQVRCQNEAGTSEWSAMSDPLVTALKPPSELEKPEVVDVGLGFVTLQWVTSEVEVDSYEICVEPLSSGEEPWLFTVEPPEADGLKSLARTGTKTEATVDGLLPRQMYRFRVRGCRKAASGPWSNGSEQVYTSSLGGTVAPPSAPRPVEVWKESLVLTWDAPAAEVARYLVKGQAEGQRVKTAGTSEVLQFQTADASTQLTVQGLRGNTAYTFWVFALTSSGLSEASPPATVRTSAQQPQPPKSLAVAHAEQTEVTLRWEPPEDDGGTPLEKYFLEVVDGSNPTERLMKEFEAEERQGTIEGLQGNQRYFFRLCAKSKAGVSRYIELLATSGPVIPGMPGVPRPLGEASATTVTLAWSPPLDTGGSSILGYSLQGMLCDSDTDYYALDLTGTKGTVQGLQAESRYRFRVCARNAAGVGHLSEWSAVVRTAPKPPGKPPRPTATAASSTSVEVTWGEALLENATPPLLWEVATELQSEFQGAMPGANVSYWRCKAAPVLVKSLVRFTSYVFRVRAMGEGGWSDWSEPSEAIATSSDWTDEEIVEFLLPKFGGSLANVFRGLDTNCDGFIRQEDLYRGLSNLGLSELSRERVAQLFASLDVPNRGMVTLRDFSKCLSRAAAPQQRSLPQSQARSPGLQTGSPQRSPKKTVTTRRSLSPPMTLTRAHKASMELTYVSPNH